MKTQKPRQLYIVRNETAAHSLCSYKVNNVETAAQAARDLLYKRSAGVNEQIGCLFIDNDSNVRDYCILAVGSVDHVTMDLKILARYIASSLATRLIIVHNHPSGKLIPSPDDIVLTGEINKVCNLFDVSLNDHIILSGTDDKFLSFKRNGLL